jgi:hypothetical protein
MSGKNLRSLRFLVFNVFPMAFALARAAGRGFIESMANGDDIDGRWSAAGELMVWIIFFFWAVWLFNAFLPPRSESTAFEAYLGQQFGQQPGPPNGGSSPAQSRMPGDRDRGEQQPGPPGPWR